MVKINNILIVLITVGIILISCKKQDQSINLNSTENILQEQFQKFESCVPCDEFPHILCDDNGCCYLCKGTEFKYENIVLVDDFSDSFLRISENLKDLAVEKIVILTFSNDRKYFEYGFVSNERYIDLFHLLRSVFDNNDDPVCYDTFRTKNEEKMKAWAKAEMAKGMEVCIKYDEENKTWIGWSSYNDAK
jgi:hypothetical protein